MHPVDTAIGTPKSIFMIAFPAYTRLGLSKGRNIIQFPGMCFGNASCLASFDIALQG